MSGGHDHHAHHDHGLGGEGEHRRKRSLKEYAALIKAAPKSREARNELLEALEIPVAMAVSHVDTLPVAVAASAVAQRINPDPAFVAGFTRPFVLATDYFGSPLLTQLVLAAFRKARGAPYEIKTEFIKVETSHLASHLVSMPAGGLAQYLALEAGMDGALASLIGAITEESTHLGMTIYGYGLATKAQEALQGKRRERALKDIYIDASYERDNRPYGRNIPTERENELLGKARDMHREGKLSSPAQLAYAAAILGNEDRQAARMLATEAKERAGKKGLPIDVSALGIESGTEHELREMVEEDQLDRKNGPIDWNVVRPRDAARLARARELYRTGRLRGPEELLYASMIFHHSSSENGPENYQIAHVLAKTALERGCEKTKLHDDIELDPQWLAKATYDRLLCSLGKPQVYGTQGPAAENADA